MKVENHVYLPPITKVRKNNLPVNSSPPQKQFPEISLRKVKNKRKEKKNICSS